MATKAWSLLRAARRATVASRAAAAAASHAALAADVAADPAAMATKASSLLRAVRRTSLASRAAAAAASRAAAAAASRAAHAADVATDVARVERLSSEDLGTNIWLNPRSPTRADYAHIPEDSKTPTDKDLESDEAIWALYERWCKAFDKKRDYAAMAQRFEAFKYSVQFVYEWNNCLPADPKLAARVQRKRRKAKLLLSKGEDASHIESCYHPATLGPFSDGGDPFHYNLLKSREKGDS